MFVTSFIFYVLGLLLHSSNSIFSKDFRKEVILKESGFSLETEAEKEIAELAWVEGIPLKKKVIVLSIMVIALLLWPLTYLSWVIGSAIDYFKNLRGN